MRFVSSDLGGLVEADEPAARGRDQVDPRMVEGQPLDADWLAGPWLTADPRSHLPQGDDRSARAVHAGVGQQEVDHGLGKTSVHRQLADWDDHAAVSETAVVQLRLDLAFGGDRIAQRNLPGQIDGHGAGDFMLLEHPLQLWRHAAVLLGAQGGGQLQCVHGQQSGVQVDPAIQVEPEDGIALEAAGQAVPAGRSRVGRSIEVHLDARKGHGLLAPGGVVVEHLAVADGHVPQDQDIAEAAAGRHGFRLLDDLLLDEMAPANEVAVGVGEKLEIRSVELDPLNKNGLSLAGYFGQLEQRPLDRQNGLSLGGQGQLVDDDCLGGLVIEALEGHLGGNVALEYADDLAADPLFEPAPTRAPDVDPQPGNHREQGQGGNPGVREEAFHG